MTRSLSLAGELNCWREILDEAESHYRASLKSSMEAHLRAAKSDDERTFVMRARDYFAAFYAASGSYLTNERMRALSPYNDKLLGLNGYRYLYFVCALQTALEVARKGQTGEQWFAFYLKAAPQVYRRPPSYIEGWSAKLDWLSDPIRLHFRLYDEVATVLGLDGMDMFELNCSGVWVRAATDIANLAVPLIHQEGWSRCVEQFLQGQTLPNR